MSDVNNIVISGRLGKEIEMRYLATGTAVVNVSLAHSLWDGKKEVTNWYKLAMFGKTAEYANNHLYKGQRVIAVGKIQQNSYTDKQGADRTEVVVTVSTIQPLEWKKKEEDEDTGNPIDLDSI